MPPLQARHRTRLLLRGLVLRVYGQPYLRAAARKVKWFVPLSVRLRVFRLGNQSLPQFPVPAVTKEMAPEVTQGARWILLALERSARNVRDSQVSSDASPS